MGVSIAVRCHIADFHCPQNHILVQVLRPSSDVNATRASASTGYGMIMLCWRLLRQSQIPHVQCANKPSFSGSSAFRVSFLAHLRSATWESQDMGIGN